MKDSWVEQIRKISIEPQASKRADFTFAVKRYVFCHVVSNKLDSVLQVIKKIAKIMTTSCQKMLQIFRESTSSTKLNNGYSFFKKLFNNYLIKCLSLFQNDQHHWQLFFIKKLSFARQVEFKWIAIALKGKCFVVISRSQSFILF